MRARSTAIVSPVRLALVLSAALLVGIVGLPGLTGVQRASADEGFKLPWSGGQTHKMINGWKSDPAGSGHTSVQEQYAYDFAMDAGTPILATKKGVVKFRQSKWAPDHCGNTTKYLNEGNYVTLWHDDGTATLYLHLQSLSAAANIGHTFMPGDTIGWSGHTGYSSPSCYSHLHFQRQYQTQGGKSTIWIMDSKPVYFDEYPGQTLSRNSDYTSQNYGISPPAAPSNVVVSAPTASSLTVTFTDNATNETGTNIERKTGSAGSWGGVASYGAISGTGRYSWTNDGLAAGTTYCYRYQAKNDAGVSAYSNEACGATTSSVGRSKIAFDEYTSSGYEIFVMNPDGSGQRQLTPASLGGVAPAISPDGTKLVFGDAGGALDVINSDGSGLTTVPTGVSASFPAWSHDGTKIAFIGAGDVYVINADGSGLTRLTIGGAGIHAPTWSPDGAQIAYVRSDPNGLDIWVMNSDGSSQRLLITGTTTPNSFPYAFTPRWSPDGRRMAYWSRCTDNSGNSCVFNVAIDGSSGQELTIGANETWSPDGGKLAYALSTGIYTINADGSGATLIQTGGSDPSWSAG